MSDGIKNCAIKNAGTKGERDRERERETETGRERERERLFRLRLTEQKELRN